MSSERETEVSRLTSEQAAILSVTRLIHRLEVRGGAGSGKTVLATTQAQTLARQGNRVAVLCYSIGLASFFERHFKAVPHKRRPASFGTHEDFAAFIVDEAQDFADDWWLPLLGALRDEEAGGLYVYSDENQRVFKRFGQPPVALVPLILDQNLRNTRQIAESFAPLTRPR